MANTWPIMILSACQYYSLDIAIEILRLPPQYNDHFREVLTLPILTGHLTKPKQQHRPLVTSLHSSLCLIRIPSIRAMYTGRLRCLAHAAHPPSRHSLRATGVQRVKGGQDFFHCNAFVPQRSPTRRRKKPRRRQISRPPSSPHLVLPHSPTAATIAAVSCSTVGLQYTVDKPTSPRRSPRRKTRAS